MKKKPMPSNWALWLPKREREKAWKNAQERAEEVEKKIAKG